MDLINWKCQTCGNAADGYGAAWVSYADIAAYEQGQKAWTEKETVEKEAAEKEASHGFLKFNVADVLLMPRPARWTVQCNTCCGSCDDAYWIPLRHLRTLADMIRKTAHLHTKSWFPSTNWIDFMASLVTSEPTPAAA